MLKLIRITIVAGVLCFVAVVFAGQAPGGGGVGGGGPGGGTGRASVPSPAAAMIAVQLTLAAGYWWKKKAK